MTKNIKHILRKGAWGLACGLVAISAGTALAGVGSEHQKAASQKAQPADHSVFPADAKPHGYSLTDMVRLTASFNSGDKSGTPPNTPFQILYSNATNNNTFNVPQGKFLYVPILYNNNVPPVIGDLPKNVEDHKELLKYWYSQSQFGMISTDIVVDGKVTPLTGSYLVGMEFQPPLPDGATQYMSVAAFLKPLALGSHTVEFRFKATGDAFRVAPISTYFPDGFWEYSLTYNVNVY